MYENTKQSYDTNEKMFTWRSHSHHKQKQAGRAQTIHSMPSKVKHVNLKISGMTKRCINGSYIDRWTELNW